MHWCIPMGLGHNDPWVESHMWPQQTWGLRLSRGQWPLVQVFGKKGHCIHILWCIFVGLGHSDPWVESHMWPQQTWGQDHLGVKDHLGLKIIFGSMTFGSSFRKKRVNVSTYFDVFSNLILQWLQKYVIAKAGETRGLRTTLFVPEMIKILGNFIKFFTLAPKKMIFFFFRIPNENFWDSMSSLGGVYPFKPIYPITQVAIMPRCTSKRFLHGQGLH